MAADIDPARITIDISGPIYRTLRIDGEAVVWLESIRQVANIREALLSPEDWRPCEAYQVADDIRRVLAEREFEVGA